MKKERNWHALNAIQRKAGPMKDRRKEINELEEWYEQLDEFVKELGELHNEQKKLPDP